jgi:sarcosine oxidase delta subunit
VNVPERAYFEGLLGAYELNQIELMRDVFVWAYERSCQQYLAVVRSTVAPDLLKLKYRFALRLAVQQIVLAK